LPCKLAIFSGTFDLGRPSFPTSFPPLEPLPEGPGCEPEAFVLFEKVVFVEAKI